LYVSPTPLAMSSCAVSPSSGTYLRTREGRRHAQQSMKYGQTAVNALTATCNGLSHTHTLSLLVPSNPNTFAITRLAEHLKTTWPSERLKGEGKRRVHTPLGTIVQRGPIAAPHGMELSTVANSPARPNNQLRASTVTRVCVRGRGPRGRRLVCDWHLFLDRRRFFVLNLCE